jgi:hypothetical protein
MLREGMSLFSREFAFTSSLLSTMWEVKIVEGTDVLNRLVFEAIKIVVLDRGTPSWIQDVDLETQAEDDDTILPTGVNIPRHSRWYVNTTPNERGSLPGTYRVRDHQLLQVKLWPANRVMLNILHEAGTAIRELHLHWIYDVGVLVPGDEPIIRNKTLDKWVGRLERVKIGVGSESSETFAGRMATDLVERTAKRLVGGERKACEQGTKTALDEVSVIWREEEMEDDEGFIKDECGMQTSYVVVERRHQ